MWVGASMGGRGGRLCAFSGNSAQCYGQDGSLGGFGVGSLYEDSAGSLWVGAGSGLWRWKPGPPLRYAMPDPGLTGLAQATMDDC